MTVVELKNISRTYGHRWALRSIDVEIEQGEKVLITGPNGAGKTTLLHIIALLLSPSSGVCTLFGQSSQEKARELRKKLGVLFMDSFLYPELSVAENLQFYARLYELDRPMDVVRDWLERVRMQPFAKSRVATLSRGERQRVSLARSLLHNPSLLLWDEPTTGLDEDARNYLLTVMRDHPDLTLLCVTHDPDLFSPYMTRSLRLFQGSFQS